MKFENFKMRIAERLNKKPNYCWANLVMWASGYRSFWSLFFKNHNENDYKIQICREGNDGTPYPYCNKCGLNGRFANLKQGEQNE